MASVPATDPLSVIVRRLCAPLLRIVAAGVALAGSLPQAAAVGVDFVYVGDAGIAADTIGYGAVASAYAIGVFELTNAQSVEFLNAVDPDGANPNSIYSPNMGSDARGGISFTSGNSAGSKYASRTSMAAKPVSFVSWFDGARFTNWLQNGGSTYGTTSSGSTAINRGAYTLNGATSGTAPAVTAGSTYRIPNGNEWYKAAYNKGSGTNAGYWTYATQSNTAPSLVGATAVGTGTAAGSSPVTTGNYANDNNGADWNGLDGNVTTVGTNGGKSAYGTFDMTGNVYEWNDLTGTSDSVRGLRGGSWSNSGAPGYMTSSDRTTAATSFDLGSVGFRLASVVPTSLSWNVGSGTWNSSALKWTNGKGCNYAFPAGSSSTFSSSSGGTVTISGSVTASAITVSATSGTYSFVSSAGNLITGTTGLAKSGGGTLVLSGSNTFTGATSVSGGKLLVDGVLASSTTTVATAALLGGSGTISGAVLVGTSGTLSPGNSPGILTVNSLSLTGSAFSRMEIVGSGSTAGVAGTSYDQVGVTTANGLSFGGTLDLDFGGRTSLFEQGTAFQLFSLSGTTSGDFTTIRTIDASGTYAGLTFSQSAYVVGEWTTWIIPGSGSQYLVFSETTGRPVALPEPSAVAMAALGAGLAGWRLVRRGRRAVAVFPRKAVIFFSEAGFGRGVRTVGGEPLVAPGGRLTNRFGVFPAAWNRSCKHPSVATGNGCRRQSEPAFRHGAVRSAPSAGGAWSFPRVETPVGNPAR